MTVSYNPEIIQSSADALYEEARTLIRNTMIRYGFFFFFFGVPIGFYVAGRAQNNVFGFLFVLLVLLIGIWVGKKSAEAKAFQLRLQAQTALCYSTIEKNTRGPAQI